MADTRRAEPDVWLTHVVAERVLETVASALAEGGIPVLPVKGVVTARRLYADVAERPIRDVDVRVRRRDFVRAWRIGRRLGWHKKDVVLLGQVLWSVDGFEVDVKSAWGPPGLCALSADELFDRAENHGEHGGPARMEPEWNDHALLLVLNVFKDGLVTTPWAVEDLRRVVAQEGVDPGVLASRARAGGVASALWIVADWMADVQGVSAWRAVRDRVGGRPPSHRVAAMYALWRRLGAPRRAGHFVVPSLADDAGQAVAGLGNAVAGLGRGYALRTIDAALTSQRAGEASETSEARHIERGHRPR
jgi:hypothetical protein